MAQRYIVKKSETVDFDEHGISTFHDYQFPFTNASLGVSEIFGRYPQSGYDVDEGVDAYWYIEKGEAEVFIAGELQRAQEGDMVFIPKGEKYFIDTHYVKLVVCSSPVWTSEQHKHIGE